MHSRSSIIAIYLVLLVLSLGVPLLHCFQTDRAIEAM